MLQGALCWWYGNTLLWWAHCASLRLFCAPQQRTYTGGMLLIYSTVQACWVACTACDTLQSRTMQQRLPFNRASLCFYLDTDAECAGIEAAAQPRLVRGGSDARAEQRHCSMAAHRQLSEIGMCLCVDTDVLQVDLGVRVCCTLRKALQCIKLIGAVVLGKRPVVTSVVLSCLLVVEPRTGQGCLLAPKLQR